MSYEPSVMRTLGGIRTRTVGALNAVPLPLGHKGVSGGPAAG